jgi:hypothetical protein
MAEKSDKKTYKFPKALGKCAERMAELRGKLDEFGAQVAPLAEEEAQLRDYLLETFKKAELDGLKSNGLQFSIVTSRVPSLADWDKFWAFAKLKGNEDLLQRAVKADAWRERLNAGKAVPGVEAFDRVGLRVVRARS